MKSEELLPWQSHASSFGMLKQSKITFGLGLKCSIESRRTVCKDNRKAAIMNAGLKIQDIF